MSWYKLVLIGHVSFGAVALCTFWITAALRKGTRTHRLLGSMYMLLMLAVMISAVPLAGAAFAAGHWLNAAFLTYLIVITGTPLWLARRAIHCRHSAAEFARNPYRLLGFINIASASAVLGLGLATGSVLLQGLSAVGLFIGVRMVRFAARGTTSRQWWLKQHYLSIIGSGIASHVAFLNVGLPRLFPNQLGYVALYAAWFGPIVVAAVAAWWLDRRYGRDTGAPLAVH